MRKLRLGEAKSHALQSDPQLVSGTARIIQPSHGVALAQVLPILASQVLMEPSRRCRLETSDTRHQVGSAPSQHPWMCKKDLESGVGIGREGLSPFPCTLSKASPAHTLADSMVWGASGARNLVSSWVPPYQCLVQTRSARKGCTISPHGRPLGALQTALGLGRLLPRGPRSSWNPASFSWICFPREATKK